MRSLWAAAPWLQNRARLRNETGWKTESEWRQRQGGKRGCDGEKRSENYRRGCILSLGRVHQRRYFFSFLLPELLPRFLPPSRASCSYNPQITNLTPERLKDQALFEVDSKEVIPAQDLARIRCKKPAKERWNTLLC